MSETREQTIARFMKFVRVAENGCWGWTGARNSEGYGSFQLAGYTRGAHRVSWELHRGPIPKELTVDHTCFNTGCQNVEHMELVTIQENIRRGRGACAQNARKTHCKYGHEFTPGNTIVTAAGRRCWTCAKRFGREWAAAHRADDHAKWVALKANPGKHAQYLARSRARDVQKRMVARLTHGFLMVGFPGAFPGVTGG